MTSSFIEGMRDNLKGHGIGKAPAMVRFSTTMTRDESISAPYVTDSIIDFRAEFGARVRIPHGREEILPLVKEDIVTRVADMVYKEIRDEIRETYRYLFDELAGEVSYSTIQKISNRLEEIDKLTRPS